MEVASANTKTIPFGKLWKHFILNSNLYPTPLTVVI